MHTVKKHASATKYIYRENAHSLRHVNSYRHYCHCSESALYKHCIHEAGNYRSTESSKLTGALSGWRYRWWLIVAEHRHVAVLAVGARCRYSIGNVRGKHEELQLDQVPSQRTDRPAARHRWRHRARIVGAGERSVDMGELTATSWKWRHRELT